MNTSSSDLYPIINHMRRAIDLAKKAEGRTSPNPMVGAVVVKNGKVVGEGYHKKAGGPHAEISALKKAGRKARGAHLILNLEPCCFQGRTPPCTEAIIESGIKQVTLGMTDPNPRVSGKGIRILKSAGVKVISGVLKDDCRKLNEVFVKFIKTKKPFVILKSALSLDGKIATASGESQWITGPKSREFVHRLRDKTDAILVGAGTVIKDNPSLTTRLKNRAGKHPVRVILDNNGRISLNAKVFKNANSQRVIYVTSRRNPASRKKRLEAKGVDVWVAEEKGGGVNLTQLMKRLAKEDLTSVLIEGGGKINASALKEKIVDKVIFFIAPILIGGKDAPGPVSGKGIAKLKNAISLKEMNVQQIGNDFIIEGYL